MTERQLAAWNVLERWTKAQKIVLCRFVPGTNAPIPPASADGWRNLIIADSDPIIGAVLGLGHTLNPELRILDEIDLEAVLESSHLTSVP